MVKGPEARRLLKVSSFLGETRHTKRQKLQRKIQSKDQRSTCNRQDLGGSEWSDRMKWVDTAVVVPRARMLSNLA